MAGGIQIGMTEHQNTKVQSPTRQEIVDKLDREGERRFREVHGKGVRWPFNTRRWIEKTRHPLGMNQLDIEFDEEAFKKEMDRRFGPKKKPLPPEKEQSS